MDSNKFTVSKIHLFLEEICQKNWDFFQAAGLSYQDKMADFKIDTLRASFAMDLFYCIQFLLLLSITSKISNLSSKWAGIFQIRFQVKTRPKFEKVSQSSISQRVHLHICVDLISILGENCLPVCVCELQISEERSNLFQF